MEYPLRNFQNGVPKKSPQRVPVALTVLTIFWILILGGLLVFWQHLVDINVPEPYLDEVFHIPQAQQYCVNNFYHWDPKITTPPGLYLTTRLAYALHIPCTAPFIRALNSVFLLLGVFPAAFVLRASSGSTYSGSTDAAYHYVRLRRLATDLHAAFNVCLFPPLFFFTALYYTDVGSTTVVLWMLALLNGRPTHVGNVAVRLLNSLCIVLAGWLAIHKHFLAAVGVLSIGQGLVYAVKVSSGPSTLPNSAFANKDTPAWLLLLLGVAALSFRQTNVFWVAVFPVGSRIVTRLRLRKVLASRRHLSIEPQRQEDWSKIINPLVDQAELEDYIRTPVSILAAVAVGFVSRFKQKHEKDGLQFASKLFGPFIPLLLGFVLFVAWNGGVVLGDKSNHIATIHLAQLLYLWPYITFFSLPLLYPYAFLAVCVVVGPVSQGLTKLAKLLRPYTAAVPSPRPINFLMASMLLVIILAVIHFNTIVHPFTLADNRHYVFYIFRILVLRHPAVKYLAAPFYLICGWLVIRALGSPESFSEDKPSAQEDANSKVSDPHVPLNKSAGGQVETRLGFVLTWLATTALCLVTAPLVEPRYFILPWIVWRLHVPSPALSGLGTVGTGKKDGRNSQGKDVQGTLLSLLFGNDHRLWIETTWLLFINAVTGYLFLYRGFEWPQEPRKVQRFLW